MVRCFVTNAEEFQIIDIDVVLAVGIKNNVFESDYRIEGEIRKLSLLYTKNSLMEPSGS